MDPRTSSSGINAKANHSPLMMAKHKSAAGREANFCPFGCTMEELDDNGYCHHLVGFSNDGKTYEPMVPLDNGMRVVRVPMKKNPQGRPVPDLPVIQKGDKLERITTSSRVYRDASLEENKSAKKAS